MRTAEFLIDAGGTLSRVVQWGLSGPAVLFVHGLGSNAGIWRAVAPELAAKGWRCFAVDAPGHGLSAKSAEFNYSLDGHVHWLGALLDALALDAMDVVASSLGGLWATGFATTYPRRVRSLTLIGAVGLAPLPSERRNWTAEYLTRMDRVSVAGRLRAAVFDPRVVDETMVEEAFRMNNSPGATAAFARLGDYYRSGINDDMQIERLATVERDWMLLLIWGCEDTIVPLAHAFDAGRRIPDCTLLALEATKHIPHVERPSIVCWALTQQLSGLRLPEGPVDAGQVTRFALAR